MKISVYVYLTLALGAPMAYADTVGDLLAGYRQQGANAFDPARGERMWQQPSGGEGRQCATCHGTDLRVAGKHATTGKPIAPLSPAANPDSLQDPEKIEKWFLRNCKWTLGRECTTQEKGDFLTFIGSRI
jgi:mono/diheme cytochrome c family protein